MTNEELKAKLNSMVKKAIEEVHERLYPKKLGEAIMMQAAEQRVTVIAEYGGYIRALQELGANTVELESVLDTETIKTIEGKY